MAFLDNSGDIILDAVLTDTGRYRLAQGNGSFKISKFALADDEINYGSYNSTHPSGSAYYDLEILQTPVLEAFTNNTSTMKSKLISIARTNLLYLPVIIPNTKLWSTMMSGSLTGQPQRGSIIGTYCVAVDEATVGTSQIQGFLNGPDTTGMENSPWADLGILNGYQPGAAGFGGTAATINHFIRLDQGLNTFAIPYTNTIDAELAETQYIVEMDNRFGSLFMKTGGAGGAAAISFIDDDNVASYYLSMGTDFPFVAAQGYAVPFSGTPIAGPQSSRLRFAIQASTELRTSTYLFENLGSTTDMTNAAGNPQEVYYIDTIIKVSGATTGYSVDLPVRYFKKKG